MVWMTGKKNLINLRDTAEQPEAQKSKPTGKHEEKASRPSKPKEAVKKADKAEMKSFRMISKIEPQKRPGRYSIFINDKFAFGVDEEVLLKFELKKGLHIDEALQKKIESDESFYKGYSKVLNYLSYSMRTEKQIKDYLKKHELAQFTDRMIKNLKEMRLIDDLLYAQSYVRTMANVNRKGPGNIIQDLKTRGVSENEILDAMEEYPEDQQLENAIILAEKQWKKSKNRSQIESIQKAKQHLVNKGYSFAMADEAVQDIDTEKDEDDEYKTLVKQADNAYKRYARKYKGYELMQRLRSFLYSKGFPNELIKRYIDERDAE